MQADAFGPLLRLEVAADGIGDHRVQFRERISLRGDAAAVARRVPARDVTAGFRARRDLENDFNNRAHARKLSAMWFGVNQAKVTIRCLFLLSIFCNLKPGQTSNEAAILYRDFFLSMLCKFQECFLAVAVLSVVLAFQKLRHNVDNAKHHQEFAPCIQDIADGDL